MHTLQIRTSSLFWNTWYETFDCVHNLFTLSQEISTLHLSEKEKEELLDSLNIISSVTHFWMVIECSYIFIMYCVNKSFLSIVTSKNFKRFSLKSPIQNMYGHFMCKDWYLKKKNVHGRKFKVLIKFFEKILLEGFIHIQYIIFSLFNHTFIKIM